MRRVFERTKHSCWDMKSLQIVSGKSGLILNVTRCFGSLHYKSLNQTGTSEKLVPFSRSECSKRKFVFHFFKLIFDMSFAVLFGKWN